MFGHGGRNCHRKEACMTCSSSDHKSECCPLLSKDENTIVLKCFNCISNGYKSVNHRANDRNCPCRLQYIKIRQEVADRNSRPPQTHLPQFQYNESSFPATLGSGNVNNRASTTHPETGNSYAQQVRSQASNLFNMEELLVIFQNTMHKLQNCTSKLDQMSVLFSMFYDALK